MTHSSRTPQEVQKADSVLELVLKDGLDIMHAKHVPPYAIIHIYIYIVKRWIQISYSMGLDLKE